jgi:hypothetical protein
MTTIYGFQGPENVELLNKTYSGKRFTEMRFLFSATAFPEKHTNIMPLPWKEATLRFLEKTL